MELVGRALVVVVDDRTAHGDEDDSGPLVTELLDEAGFVVDGVVVVAADEVEIRNALNTAVIGGVDLVVSVGGTGVTPRDVTPEATLDILDREVLGIAEAIRASGLSAGIIEAGLSAVWPAFPAAPWWSISPARDSQCATAWRRSTRWRPRSSGNSPAWRSDAERAGR